MARKHGEWSCESVPPLLYLTLSGPFNKEGGESLVDELSAEMPGSMTSIRALLIDLTEWQFGTPEAMALFQRFHQWMALNSPVLLCSYVTGSSLLKPLFMERCWPQYSPIVRHYSVSLPDAHTRMQQFDPALTVVRPMLTANLQHDVGGLT